VAAAAGVPGAPLKERDCSHAVFDAVLRNGSAMCPTLSETVIVQLALNTQLTAGKLTSTMVSGAACALPIEAQIAAAASHSRLFLRHTMFDPQTMGGDIPVGLH